MIDFKSVLKDTLWIFKRITQFILVIFFLLFLLIGFILSVSYSLDYLKENPLSITEVEIWEQKELGMYLEENDRSNNKSIDNYLFIYVLSKNIKYNNEEYYMFGSRYEPHRSFKDFQRKFLIKKSDIDILEIERYKTGSTIYSLYCSKLFVFNTYKPRSENLNYKTYEIKNNQSYRFSCGKQYRKNHIKLRDEWIIEIKDEWTKLK